MKRTIIIVMLMMFLFTSTTALAGTADSEGYYRADFTIDPGVQGYGPANYNSRNSHSYNNAASYELQGYRVVSWGRSVQGSGDSVKVHVYNRQLAKQVTSRLSVSEGNTLKLPYSSGVGSSYTYKPVCYKTNTEHYIAEVELTARFRP